MISRYSRTVHLMSGLLACVLFLSISLPARADTFREAFNRGKSLQESGDDEGAINSFILASSLAPSPLNDARLELARIYAKVGRYAESESQWAQILPHTKDLSLKYEYGQFLVNQGKFNAALSVWGDILSQNPNDPTALYFMGLCLEATDNIDSSQGYYLKVVAIAPTSQLGQMANAKLTRLGHATEARASSKFFPVDPEFGSTGLGWWNLQNMPIHVYIDDGAGVSGYRTEMKNYVIKALEAWRQASNGKIYFVLDPPDPRGEMAWKDVFGRDTDPLRKLSLSRDMPGDPVKTGIHVHWVSSLGGVAIGLAWTNPFANKVDASGNRDCSISSGHIWLHTNSLADGSPLPAKLSAANSSTILDKQDRIMSEVTVHEFGHALGLLHSPNPKDVMCSGIFALNSTDLLEGRSLSRGDLGSLAEHYNHFEGTGFPSQLAKAPDDSTNAIGQGIAVLSAANGLTGGAAGSSSAVEVVKPVPKYLSDINNVVFDINTRQFSQGLSKLDKLLKNEPANPPAHYLRGVIFVLMHNYKDAAKDYAEVIKLSPGTELAKRASEGLEKIKIR